MTSPIQDLSGLPRFSEITPEQILPAVEKAVQDCKEMTAELLKQEHFTWENLVDPLDEVNDVLSRIWSPVSHTNAVVNTDALREAHDSCLPMLSDYGTWVGQHEGLYAAYLQIKQSDQYDKLSQAQKKVLDNTIRDFELSGVALDADKKQQYAENSSKQAELGSQFSNNVMDANVGWDKHITDINELKGLPPSALDAAAQAAQEQGKEGWLFTLDVPSYLPVLMYCENRELRAEMYSAYGTRASDQGVNAGKWDNAPIIDQLLQLRADAAELLGFDNYASRSLATKMAKSTEQVNGFLSDLAKRSKPQAERELQEVRDFAAKEYQQTDIDVWDIPYYSELLKQQRYSVSDEMLRPYFPESRVVEGLFEVANRLYGITIKEKSGVDTWHKDAKYFEIFDADGELQAGFYLDLYARAHKRGGAWMDECQVRRYRLDGSLQLPIAYLVCNFNGPVGDKPALFTHDEVVTLFHEFGHGLHHMLTKTDAAGVSGINGVAWDAVELPSQFFENWCWQEEALSFISGHYETGEPLPKDLLDKMLDARNFQSAMQMVRQLEFSIFDMRLHEQSKPVEGMAQSIIEDVRSEVAVIIPPAFQRFQTSFSHIFAGGYAAGYYSYKWAEVLSSDAFGRFEEEGIFNRDTGRSFLQNILEKGGSDEPMELFKAFRGREPEIDALLRHSGIQA